MRDGEHRDCPIVPNDVVRLRYGEGEDDNIVVAPSHDAIQMFPDPRYTHLRYWDHTDGQMKAVWLNDQVMADLADAGIPITIRESITDTEHELYERYVGQIALATAIEVDPVANEVAHLDAEIDYYFGHGGIEDL